MKSKVHPSPRRPAPTEADVREYAYHLYEQSGRLPGHDVEHWLEAQACLMAGIPRHRSHVRLHRLLHGPVEDELCAQTIEARNVVC